MNRQSEFDPILGRGRFHVRAGEELIPGRGRFHVHAGGNESRPVVGTTVLKDRIPGNLICTLSARNDRVHAEGEAGAVARRKGMVKTFWRALAWRKLVF